MTKDELRARHADLALRLIADYAYHRRVAIQRWEPCEWAYDGDHETGPGEPTCFYRWAVRSGHDGHGTPYVRPEDLADNDLWCEPCRRNHQLASYKREVRRAAYNVLRRMVTLADRVTRCPDCGGYGTDINAAQYDCPHCGGSGRVEP